MTSIGGIGGYMPPAQFGGGGPPSFDTLDSDSSGGITLDELKAGSPGGASDARSAERAEQLFEALDADGDGTVTETEKETFDAEREQRLEATRFLVQLIGSGETPQDAVGEIDAESVVEAADGDGDGSISLDELASTDAAEGLSDEQIEELFSALDGDSDGAISSDEVDSFLEETKSAAGGRPPGPPPGGPPPGGGGAASASNPLDLLTTANSAYQSAADLTSELTSLFANAWDDAA